MTTRQARAYCKRYPQRAIDPGRVADALRIPRRAVPERVLPMTGSEVLEAAQDPPSWLVDAQDRAADASARARSTGQAREAARAAAWTRQDLADVYYVRAVKDGMAPSEAKDEALRAAAESIRLVGPEAVGVLPFEEFQDRAAALEQARTPRSAL
ncbi:hypothetical protein [Kitasatospora sp. NPDC088783]|uniref:hypothetical protein n=1 Tax=Kitasatospora sp. NPDC088783 TaxID=3364077 RepID=UPI00382B18DA